MQKHLSPKDCFEMEDHFYYKIFVTYSVVPKCTRVTRCYRHLVSLSFSKRTNRWFSLRLSFNSSELLRLYDKIDLLFTREFKVTYFLACLWDRDASADSSTDLSLSVATLFLPSDWSKPKNMSPKNHVFIEGQFYNIIPVMRNYWKISHRLCHTARLSKRMIPSELILGWAQLILVLSQLMSC